MAASDWVNLFGQAAQGSQLVGDKFRVENVFTSQKGKIL